MRHLPSAFILAACLAWPMPSALAQEVTASCKDATTFAGASRRGACARHGGVLTFGPAAAGVTAAPNPSMPGTPAQSAAPVAASVPAPMASAPVPAAVMMRAPAPQPARPVPAAAAGGGMGQVWVNRTTKIYHCPGTRYYGKTQSGAYMTEASAAAEGDRPSRGKACSPG